MAAMLRGVVAASLATMWLVDGWPAAAQVDAHQNSEFSSSAPQPEKSKAVEEKEEEHKPADPDTGKSTLSNETLGLLPNPFEKQGVKVSASYIADVMGNFSGGLHQGAVYEGRLHLAIDLDLAKLAAAQGLSFHANIFQIHGRGLSRDEIGNIMLCPVSKHWLRRGSTKHGSSRNSRRTNIRSASGSSQPTLNSLLVSTATCSSTRRTVGRRSSA
jgi:hypothetical protein